MDKVSIYYPRPYYPSTPMTSQAKGERKGFSKAFIEWNNTPVFTVRGTTAWGLFMAFIWCEEKPMKWILLISFALVCSLITLQEREP